MARPAWFPDKPSWFAHALVAQAESCPVELQTKPYLRALAAMLEDQPITGIDLDMFQAWLPTYQGAFSMTPMLLAVTDDETRFIAGLGVLLEAIMRGLEDAFEYATEVMEGKKELAQVVAAMEVVAVKQSVGRTERRAADDEHGSEEEMRAELAGYDQLEADSFTIPLPPSAEGASDDFVIPARLDRLAALYRAWARRDGWLLEDEVTEPGRYIVQTFVRGAHRIELMIRTWIRDQVAMKVTVPPGTVLRRVPGARSVAKPAPPALSRARPKTLPSTFDKTRWKPAALAAADGLLLAVTEDGLWFVDTATNKPELLAEGYDNLSAVALAGEAVYFAEKSRAALHRLDLATGETRWLETGDGVKWPGALVVADGVAYVVCEGEYIVAVSLTDRTARRLTEGKLEYLSSVCVHDGTLYASADKKLHAIDRATGAFTAVVEAPRFIRGLASDGSYLYGAHSNGITRIDVAARTFDQIAGLTRFGEGNLSKVQSILAGTPTTRDGAAEASVVDAPYAPAYDANGLWFLDRDHALRRLAFAERTVTTLPIG